jgi:predicted dehydrogenase
LAKRKNANTRREFLATSAAAVAAGSAIRTLQAAPAVHPGGSDILRVALIGCGRRGTGAAKNCLNADPNIRLVAMADMFQDRIDGSLRELQKEESLAKKLAVTKDGFFTGFDCHKKALEAGVDIAVLAAPPHFRPAHIEACVAKNVHIFAEKPVAVDAPGVRRVFAACAEAEKKKLSVVSGLCWRYHFGMRDTFAKIHAGDIGEIVAMQCTYNAWELWSHSLAEKKQKGWSDMEWQIRNWLYFTWLSGDHNVEQHIHSLDKMAWAMHNEPPKKAIGLGGRQVRTAADFGNIFDHHAVVYEYANGVRCYSLCRQQNDTHREVADQIVGVKGVCDINAGRGEAFIKIRGASDKPWTSRNPQRKRDDMYQNEHDFLLKSIREHKPINDGDWMTKSTLMAIMGRMATYTGQEITWADALKSTEDLTPKEYVLGPRPTPPVARPGFTKFS